MEEGSPYNRQWYVLAWLVSGGRGSQRYSNRSYLKGLEKGFFTQNPAKFNDPHVCDPYRR